MGHHHSKVIEDNFIFSFAKNLKSKNQPTVNDMIFEQKSEFYRRSGLFHTAELCGLMNCYQWWPKSNPDLSEIENGRQLCDDLGIKYQNDLIELKDLANCLPKEQFDDIQHHYLTKRKSFDN